MTKHKYTAGFARYTPKYEYYEVSHYAETIDEAHSYFEKLEIETGDVFVDIFEIDDKDTHDIIGYKKDGTPIYN